MVDIDHFYRFRVMIRMRNRPTKAFRLVEVHRALVVRVVQLRRPDERIEARRIDVVGDQFLDDFDIVPLSFVKEWQATFHRVAALERANAKYSDSGYVKKVTELYSDVLARVAKVTAAGSYGEDRTPLVEPPKSRSKNRNTVQ